MPEKKPSAETRAVSTAVLIFMIIAIALPRRSSAAFRADMEAREAGLKGMSRPSISPQGTRLAFEWMSSIWTVSIEGGPAEQLTDWTMRRFSPEWSPDGKSIACIASDKDIRRFEIQVHDAGKAEGGRTLWRTEKEIKPALSWSPDGKSVAFSAGSDQKIYMISLDGGEPRAAGFSGLFPRWSPDGRFLAFQTADNRDLWIVSPSDGTKTRLASDISVNGGFCWSPDGQELVYESVDRESVDLWKVPVRGGHAFPLTDDIALEQDPRWHPSNGHIYFSHRRQIWRIPASGGKMSRLTIQCRLPESETSGQATVYAGADVLDVKTGRLLGRQSILVLDGRITKIGPRLAVPKNAKVIDVKGLTAVPGLIDMHVHYQPWNGPYFLRFGVTRLQEMGCADGTDRILSLRDEIDAGLAPGPTLHACGTILNGSGIPGPPGLGGIQSASPEIIRKALAWQLQEGIDVVKIGSENTAETLKAIIELAHAHGRRVMGHIALVPLDEAISMGQDGIEHPRGVGWGILPPAERPNPVPRKMQGMLREAVAWWDPDKERLAKAVDLMVEKNVIWDPTLYVWGVMSTPGGTKGESEYPGLPEWVKQADMADYHAGFQGTWLESDYEAFGKGLPSMRQMVGDFHRKGGLVTAGTDGGIPGLGFHQELEQLRLAGLSGLECLRAATINAAKSLQREGEIGSLEEGKIADIVFVKGNPLENLTVLKQVAITVQRGRIVYKIPS